MRISKIFIVSCLCLGVVSASEESPSSLEQLLERIYLLKQQQDAEGTATHEDASRELNRGKGANERKSLEGLIDKLNQEHGASKQGRQLSHEHEPKQEEGVEGIVSAMQRRSEVMSKPLREVFREVADSYRQLENRIAGRTGDTAGEGR